MTTTNTGRRVVLVGLVALIAAMLPLSGASAAHLTGVTQLTTVDDADAEPEFLSEAAEAAIAWSNPAAFPDGGLESGARDPEHVLIGRDNIFPDNLASGALQTDGSTDADTTTDGSGPLLLTDTDTLYEEVVEEIERLGVDDAIILGEFEAISEEVEDQLNDLLDGDVTRLGGPTRIETAIEVTEASGATTAILARAYDTDGGDSSQAFADSLAAGGWAANEGYGVLLTQGEVLTPSVAAYLAEGDIDEVIIVGGEAAISSDVQDEVEAIDGIDVSRVGGDNRADTAIDIAGERGVSEVDSTTDGIILVEGYEEDSWASGFPAAATSALEGDESGYPIVLSNGFGLPPETEDFAMGSDETDDNNIDLVCGPLMPGAGPDGPDDDNVTEILAPACAAFADASEAQTFVSGIVIEFDTDNDTFELLTDADTGTNPSGETETVDYDDEDTFFVDGEEVDVDEFEANISEGDDVTVAESGDGKVIRLRNAECTAVNTPLGCVQPGGLL